MWYVPSVGGEVYSPVPSMVPPAVPSSTLHVTPPVAGGSVTAMNCVFVLVGKLLMLAGLTVMLFATTWIVKRVVLVSPPSGNVAVTMTSTGAAGTASTFADALKDAGMYSTPWVRYTDGGGLGLRVTRVGPTSVPPGPVPASVTLPVSVAGPPTEMVIEGVLYPGTTCTAGGL